MAQIELEVDAATAKMWREASPEIKSLVTKYIEDQINITFDTENEDNRLTEEDTNKRQ
jgi:hypothetical protein